MAITVDASSISSLDIASPISWNHTCSGNQGVLLVSFNYNFVSFSSFGTPTYAGVSMLPLQQSTLSTSGIATYYLMNPPLGTNAISCTYTAVSMSMLGCSISLNGVMGLDSSATSSGVATAISTNDTTIADNSFLVDSVTMNGVAPALTVDASQNQIFNSTIQTGGVMGMSTKSISSHALSQMKWTGSGLTAWAQTIAGFSPSGFMFIIK